MSFGDSIKHCLTNYANFNGRAGRPEFWYFVLFHFLVVGIPAFIGFILIASSTTISPDGTTADISAFGVFGWIIIVCAALISLALVIPHYAVGSRRLHDRGTSGWLQLLVLVPCGAFVLLIFWLLESKGPNAYGEGPARV